MHDQPDSADTVEMDSGRRWRRPGWLPAPRPGRLALAALVVGLVAGYGAGVTYGRGAAAPAPAASRPASPAAAAPAVSFSFDGAPALGQGTQTCSVQSGHMLELGVEVTNSSSAPVTLGPVTAVLPLGGLKQVGTQWGTCGALASALAPNDVLDLLSGESDWLTITFRVTVRCPGPLPVQFSVGYVLDGKQATATLPGFPDLGQVPYSGCPAT
jgi:hypothetical protein